MKRTEKPKKTAKKTVGEWGQPDAVPRRPESPKLAARSDRRYNMIGPSRCIGGTTAWPQFNCRWFIQGPLTLEPDLQRTRGGRRTLVPAAASPSPLKDTVSLGGPFAIPIRAKDAQDEDLRRFIKAEAKISRFDLVHLTCAFESHRGEPFVSARIVIELARTDGVTAPQPIVWSMQPQRLASNVEVSDTAKIGAKLKLAEVGGEHTVKTTRQRIYLEALHEMEPTPTWELYRTRSTEIRGAPPDYDCPVSKGCAVQGQGRVLGQSNTEANWCVPPSRPPSRH